MSGGGYDIGAGFSSTSPSASSIDSPFYNQGGGGGLQIFAAGSKASNIGSPSTNKTALYVGAAVVVAVLALVFILFKK